MHGGDALVRGHVRQPQAAGDVAQAPGFFDPGKSVNATLPNASVQGRIAGMDMVDDPALKPYPGSSGLNTLKGVWLITFLHRKLLKPLKVKK